MPKPKPSKRHAPKLHAVVAPVVADVPHFAGIDVGTRELFVCIKNAAQEIVWEGMIVSTVEALDRAMGPFKASLVRVAFETGVMVAYLHDGLVAAGYPVMVLHAYDVRQKLGKGIKTDRADARGIAGLLAGNVPIKTVAVREPDDQRMRVFLAARRRLLGMARMIENSLTSNRFHGGADNTELTIGDGIDGIGLKALVDAASALKQHARRLDEVLEEMAHADPRCNLVMTVPGIGPVAALAFVSALSRPERFRSSRSVGAFLGLVPRVTQSGVRKPLYGGITRMGDAMTRGYLYTAANAILVQSPDWSPLTAWGLAQAERRGATHARVAVARRLAVIMHRILITGERYRPELLAPREAMKGSAKGTVGAVTKPPGTAPRQDVGLRNPEA